MTRSCLTAVMLVLAIAAPAIAQPTVFVVRHAERADASPGSSPTMSSDPDLSAAGHARAASLATVLKDAGITAIFVTEYKRTQQTAAPLAKALGITPTIVKATDPGLTAAIQQATGNVLVVGHSNTVPGTIKNLGVGAPLTVGDDEFDNLFIVTPGRTPQVLRLHYR
jgi:phosphohistidine phosphatase SixA